jgi:hypothetical protein
MVFVWSEAVNWDMAILLLGLLIPVALAVLFTLPKSGRPGR